MVGGMMETRLAMTCSAHFAAGVGGCEFIDLDTPFFIKDDFMSSPCPESNGVYDLSSIKAGIGVVPSRRG